MRPEIESLETSKIAEIFALGFGRPDLILLRVGEGDLPTPDFISDAAIASLKAGDTFYTAKRGIPALRQAISGSVCKQKRAPFGGAGAARSGLCLRSWCTAATPLKHL